MLRLLTFLSALFLATAAAATTLWVDAPRDGFLNLRTGPSTSYYVLGQMPHGSKVKVLATPGKWYKVRHESGTVGWAHSAFLSSHPVPPLHDPHYGGKPGYDHGKPGHPHGKPGHDYGQPTGAEYWVHAPGYSGLNLRHGPGGQYPVVMTMAQGDRVVELGRQGIWLLVRHESGRVGWAHGDYLVHRYPGYGYKPGKPWKHDPNGHWDGYCYNDGQPWYPNSHKGGKDWDHDGRYGDTWDQDRDRDHDGRKDGDHKGHKKDAEDKALAEAVKACAGRYGEEFNRCVLRKMARIQ